MQCQHDVDNVDLHVNFVQQNLQCSHATKCRLYFAAKPEQETEIDDLVETW